MGKGKKTGIRKPVLLKKMELPAMLSFLSYMGDVQGCGTIRVLIPYLLLNHYRAYEGKLRCMSTWLHSYIPDVEFYKKHTLVQFQRSATKEHLEIFKHFKSVVQKKYPIPIVYEIDDMLIDIPDWNYANKYYKDNEEYVKQIISMSDTVIASTHYLAKVYSEYNPRVQVIPNHLPKFLWGDIYPAHQYCDENERIKILWSGSQNHFHHPAVTGKVKGGDFGDELLKFIIKTADIYEWIFIGAIPQELIGIKDKITFVPWQDPIHYPKVAKDMEPDIAIAPLIDNHFNRCKSNIKQLEFVAMGAAGVYTNTEPYKKCHCRTNTDEEMISYIEKMAKDIDFRAKTWRKDRESVESQLFWEEHNNLKRYINTYLTAFGRVLP